MQLLISQHQCLGDLITLTSAIRDLKAVQPDWQIGVDVSIPDVFCNNPRISKEVRMGHADRLIKAEYPLIHSSGKLPYHFIHGFRMNLEKLLGITIPQGQFHGQIFLTEEEKKSTFGTPYWLINAGYKSDFPLKYWGHFQELVNELKDQILFIQVGSNSDIHPPLCGAVNMVGRTNIRELFSLAYNAVGAVTGVSALNHIMPCFRKPVVTIAGGRESHTWQQYQLSQVFHSIGYLDCCRFNGCWKKTASECKHPVYKGTKQIGKCFDMIDFHQVADAVRRFNEQFSK